ncbi:STAS domain-containing protein [Streptacidiphilus sp. PB12-B1b]|uniref:STAS domain-containing protein n=1 Tax=Streptacidiphilus sp. PB12-B1b TaxID=2705012 RepID=UPI0015FA2558|nr:STAS domain-containing protein [Streptacidiphilus sp. PB12-B1b]QMU77110.1 STAS domain-containing protein [Streptacidiphilus sp. PB12-B1b]
MDSATGDAAAGAREPRAGTDPGAPLSVPPTDCQALTVSSRPDSTGVLVRAEGDLDFETADTLRDLLNTVVLIPGQRLTLDLDAVDFFDSSGLGALLAARSLAQQADATVELLPPPEHIARVLEAVGLTSLFAIRTDPGGGTTVG